MSEHCHCGHDHDHEHDGHCHCEEDFTTITLTLESGEDVVCEVLDIFEFEDREYISLVPENDEIILIYDYEEEGDEVIVTRIEDGERYDAVRAAYEEFLDYMDEEEEEEA